MVQRLDFVATTSGWLLCKIFASWQTCQPPEYKNLETSRNLCIVRMSIKTMSRNNLRKSPKRHSERPGDLMKNLETPGETRRVGRTGMSWWHFKFALCPSQNVQSQNLEHYIHPIISCSWLVSALCQGYCAFAVDLGCILGTSPDVWVCVTMYQSTC